MPADDDTDTSDALLTEDPKKAVRFPGLWPAAEEWGIDSLLGD